MGRTLCMSQKSDIAYPLGLPTLRLRFFSYPVGPTALQMAKAGELHGKAEQVPSLRTSLPGKAGHWLSTCFSAIVRAAPALWLSSGFSSFDVSHSSKSSYYYDLTHSFQELNSVGCRVFYYRVATCV